VLLSWITASWNTRYGLAVELQHHELMLLGLHGAAAGDAVHHGDCVLMSLLLLLLLLLILRWRYGRG
jgi:hypothetical protein